MESWKFLLQKEGDRSWLPLDSPDAEILEGRYRIVARSSQPNIEVEIRISHLTIGEDPPKRRIQKRSNRTNQDGLMVVIPYTRLQPGIWELCCSSTDLMSDLLGDSWQYAVKLQVLAQEVGAEETWEPDWSPAVSEVHSHPGESSMPTHPSTALVDGSAAIEFSESAVESPTESPVVASTDQHDAATPAETVVPSEAAVSVNSGEPAAIASSDAQPTETEATSREPIQLSPEVSEILGASMDRLFQIAEQMSSQLVDEVLRDFDLIAPLEEASPIEPEPPDYELADASLQAPPVTAASENAIAVAENPPPVAGYRLRQAAMLALKLDQETLIACRGEVLTITGQVVEEDRAAMSETAETDQSSDQFPADFNADRSDFWNPDADSLDLMGATAQELQLYLRDPQSLQVLVSDRLPLPDHPLPFPFSFSFSLPEEITTHLILGEVLLCGALPSRQGTLSALMTQAFTVTVDPKELVGELTKLSGALDETLAKHPEEEKDRIDLPMELSHHLEKEKEKELSLNLSFLDPEPAATAGEEQPHRFATLAGHPLPPQLYQPDPNQSRNKPIELPEFAFPVTQSDPVTQTGVDASTTTDAAIESSAEESAATPTDLGELFSLPEEAEVTVAEPLRSEAEPESIAPDAAPQPIEPELTEASVASPSSDPPADVSSDSLELSDEAQVQVSNPDAVSEVTAESSDTSDEPEAEPSPNRSALSNSDGLPGA
ncbi:hypothetical protein K9N68_28230 [Kovacikia minuta CCNUW1]|uniref:hypothetical protein n=1 Tax=Kovacikia minuta TaxID=2931930 RepID=UPI001CC9664E|nr:hypothetical protein [Kovacikia minuta]UBF25440.1 hypothetical protein K9N68_28230 [Kovacikia minuta CCNUW1]